MRKDKTILRLDVRFARHIQLAFVGASVSTTTGGLFQCMIRPSPSETCEWKPLYEAALSESDERKLLERISAARNAILDRIEVSLTTSRLPGEHRVVDDALRNLRRLAQLATSRAA